MINIIENALKANDVSVYSYTHTTKESVELFFIKKKLDTRRETKTNEYRVNVYVDFTEDGKKYRGTSSVAIYDGMTAEEVNEKIKSAKYAASFVKNKFYELYKGKKAEHVSAKSNMLSDWRAFAMKTAEVVYSVDTREEVFINSLEVFANKNTVHIVNSEGVDASYETCEVRGEFVAQCVLPQDVETYEDFKFDSFDEDQIVEKVLRTLDMTKDRANAVAAPAAGTYRVILSGDEVAKVMSYYTDRTDTAYIYPGYSKVKTGDDMQGENVIGDRISITLCPTVPFSAEGIPMEKRVLLDEGIIKVIHGGNRYAQYLGVEPTGDYSKIAVKPGNVSFEDMKKDKYLYVVNFSDFQMDSLTGHFGGEIRLAYLFDGKRVVPVTGGSVNGSLIDTQKNIHFSSEIQKNMEFEGPFAMCIEGIAVAGN